MMSEIERRAAAGSVGARPLQGQIVLAGSFTRPGDIAAGDVIQVDYGSLGTLGVAFR